MRRDCSRNYCSRQLVLWLFVCVLTLAPAFEKQAISAPPGAPHYVIYLLGFADAEHTSTSGVQRSSVGGYGAGGITSNALIGQSDRYSATGQNGESGWVFDTTDESTTRLGLLDPQYFVNPGNNHLTIPWFVNTAGQVVGITSTDPTTTAGRNLGWFYDPTAGSTTRIGYSTLTNPPGLASDVFKFLKNDGFVAGVSNETNNGAPYAWAFDPASSITRQIGLPESTVTGPGTNPIMQTVNGVSDGDQVAGTSFRQGDSSSPASGPAVWIYDPRTLVTKRIGFFDVAHTLAAGQQQSEFKGINPLGLVAGRSYFQGTSSQFGDAWLYDPSIDLTRSIGFGNPATGTQWSDDVVAITPQNRVYGTSTSSNTIRTWVYDYAAATTTIMGLTTGDNVLSNGGSQNSIVARTNSGFVLGHAKRGVGDTRDPFNRTPWVYDPTTGITHAAGLTAGGYTTTGNGRWATALQINEIGQAIGTSRLFSGTPSNVVRDSSWFFDPTTSTTTEIASAVAVAKQASTNTPNALNNNGQVVGIARNTTSNKGDFVWFYDNSTKNVTSDFDVRNQYTVRTSGGADLFIDQLTDSGLVLGESTRFSSPSNSIGKTQWLYDFRTKTTYDLTFSQKAGSGDAYTNVVHLSDDGTMFGEYDSYSGSSLLGRRYFYWSIPLGFIDLQSLVAGDISGAGWRDLVHSSGFSLGLQYVSDGLLIGRGLRSNGNNLPFALILVPEPNAALLLCAAALTLSPFCRGRWRRRSAG
jgi:hypothetical protein